MLVGLSFSRCVKEIVDGKVDINNVLIIIARTNFDPLNDEDWTNVWNGYRTGMYLVKRDWSSYSDQDEKRVRDVTIRLLQEGKLHQPRQFGGYPVRRSEIWLETVLPNEELERNPAAKKAWDHFQTVASLTDVILDKEIH
jgi:hypothetical protein